MANYAGACARNVATSTSLRYMLPSVSHVETSMPKMSDNRRKRIQAKQRKATNALKRATKAAKRERNSAKAG
jgi:hypothetical protein